MISSLNELRTEVAFLRRAATGRTDELWPGFGLPFNGQKSRLATVRLLQASYAPDVFLETGTFMGHTTRFFLGGGVPVHTVEVKWAFYVASRIRLGWGQDLTITRADSANAIAGLHQGAYARPFAYLDAHWWRALPLVSEVGQLLGGWSEMIIVIDDCEVPGDPGYTFDSYEGTPLGLGMLDLPEGTWVGYPGVPSAEETGAKRGTLYLAKGEAATRACELAVAQGLMRPASAVQPAVLA